MNLRTLWLTVALGASPLVANAQISADVSFNWSSSAPGESVDSTDVFYDQLSPYGVWVNDPTVGQAYIPDQDGYVPYTNGHWENTDVGFVWISDEPFAWATSHYGRWWFSNDYGRWVWVPDTTWGPSWVDWYEAGDDLGWAPLAPDIVVQAGYEIPVTAYHYCAADHVLDRDVTRYYEPRERVEVIHRQSRPIAHRATIGSHQVVAGPAPERLAAHRVRAPQPKHLDAKVMGRMPPTELRAAEQRAQQRKPQIDQQNAKRLEAHAEIQKVVQQRATKAPGRPTTRTPNAVQPNDRNTNDRNTNDRNTNDRNTNDRNTNERATNPRVNDVDRAKEPTPATPNAATPRPDVNRREDNRAPNRPEPNRAEPNRAEPKQPDVNRAPTRPEPNATMPRPEPQRAEPPMREPARPEPPRAEPARPEPQRAEPTRPEPQHAAPPRPEPARPEPTRIEPPRPEPQRAEPTRAEPTRAEPQRAEPARPEPHAAPPRGHDKADDKRKP